jgi:hypothetical protein
MRVQEIRGDVAQHDFTEILVAREHFDVIQREAGPARGDYPFFLRGGARNS